VSALGQLLNERHHLRDVFGRPRVGIGAADAQLGERIVKGLDVGSGVGGQILSGGRGIANDLVLDVGDVHDLLHAQAAELEVASQQIAPQEGAHVADVQMVVDGRPARVHAHFARNERLEGLFLARERVEKLEFRHGRGIIRMKDGLG
jgi:hypothetical protein